MLATSPTGTARKKKVMRVKNAKKRILAWSPNEDAKTLPEPIKHCDDDK